MNKHTRGPWRPVQLKNENPREPDIRMYVDSDSRQITPNFDGDEEDLANIKLMAAAPELLLALEAMYMLVTTILPPNKEFTTLTHDTAKSAIAKAKGD